SSFDLNNHFDSNILRMEKYAPKHVYTAVHQDGKSGTYYVKRFKFEDQPIGKRLPFINEAQGSKLIVLTNGQQPMARIKLLKGKTQTPETLEQSLNELIDMKGMKAQGNRLSFHTVKKVELLSDEIDLAQEPEQGDQNNAGAKQTQAQTSDSAPVEQQQTGTSDTSIDEKADNSSETAELSETQKQQSADNEDISLEITNPDDITLDDNGQTSLF